MKSLAARFLPPPPPIVVLADNLNLSDNPVYVYMVISKQKLESRDYTSTACHIRFVFFLFL